MRGRASAWRVRKQCGERRQGQSVILKSDFKQPERETQTDSRVARRGKTATKRRAGVHAGRAKWKWDERSVTQEQRGFCGLLQVVTR